MKPKEITLIYTGRRLMNYPITKEVVQSFKDPKTGEEHKFKGIKGLWIGKTVKATKTKDNLSMKVRPDSGDTDALIDEKERDTWWAKDRAAEAFLEEQRALKKAKAAANQRLSPELKKLKEIYQSLGHTDRRYFAEYIANMFQEKKRKKRA